MLTLFTKSAGSFHSPCRDQQTGPRLIFEPADLYARMTIRRVVDEAALSYVHASMGDIAGRRAEEQKVAGLEMFPLYLYRARPCRLQIGVAGHRDAAAANQHLCETGAVKTEAGSSAPGVGDANESFAQIDRFGNGQCSRV